MRIGIAQIETRAGDFAGAARRMADCSRRAAEAGVELLVFPAAALCGVAPVPRTDREGFLLDLMESLVQLLDELACPCLIPLLIGTDDAPMTEALLVDGDQVNPVRLTARLEALAASEGGEPAADALPEVAFGGARLGVAFTYDDLATYDDYDYDVDVIVFLSGYGFAVGRPVERARGRRSPRGGFLADAEATGAWIVGAWARSAATTGRSSAGRALCSRRGASSRRRRPPSRRTCSYVTWTPPRRARSTIR